MGLRGPGGGFRIRKKVSRRYLNETVKRQQLVINALCEKLEEGRLLVNELVKGAKVYKDTPPLIVPATQVPSVGGTNGN